MPSVLVVGGSGQLGAAVVQKFHEANWKVVSASLAAAPSADHSVLFQGNPKDDADAVATVLTYNNIELDVVINVAGGFMMGSISSDAVFASLKTMLDFNLGSSLVAAHVATRFLRNDGLLVLTGAEGALRPTPAFVAYGASKAATHHLVSSVANDETIQAKNGRVVAVLPVMLDTQQNRKDMPDANFSDWTPLPQLAQLLFDWANAKPEDRFPNGSLLEIRTVAGQTSVSPVDVTVSVNVNKSVKV